MQGNSIGADTLGNSLGNSLDGIRISQASGNLVGGVADGAGNLIAFNHQHGVRIDGPLFTSSNRLQGNQIIRNLYSGVRIGDSSNNMIGGAESGAGNQISANGVSNSSEGFHSGVEITGSLASGNVVQGNLIGVDATGLLRDANGDAGVIISDGANSNTVGGTESGMRNTISGNFGLDSRGQVVIAGSNGNRVVGNYVGTDRTGAAPIFAASGVPVAGVRAHGYGNLIGGSLPGAGNVIAGGNSGGVILGSGNALIGNLIGVDVSGAVALGNGEDFGVQALSNNTILSQYHLRSSIQRSGCDR